MKCYDTDMNYNFKPLINLAVATLGILILFLLVEIGHVSSTPTTNNTVSFTAEGKVSAKPNIAEISASVVTQASDAKTAQDQNSNKSNAVKNFLKSQGIADEDIKTSNYNVYPQYNYSGGQQNIVGYQVSE